MLKETPSQTAGPYVHIGCVPNFCGIDGVYAEDLGSRLLLDGARGERITIRGQGSLSLSDQPLLYAPTVGVPSERVRANQDAIFEVFGS